MTFCVHTNNNEETIRIGESIGKLLQGGEILELVSDVGGGKTTLAKGIVAAIGCDDVVTSPTFTVSKVYEGKNLTLHHYDYYRLGELGLMSEELQEVLADNEAVTVIEWAGAAHDLLPADRLIKIELHRVADSEDTRKIRVRVPEHLKDWQVKLKGKAC